MTLKNSNLRTGNTGDLVAFLHRILLFLGQAIDESERKRTFFGETTRNAVLKVQKANRLETSGMVDDKTAVLLEDMYRKGLAGSEFFINGRVLTPEGKSVAEARVELWAVLDEAPRPMGLSAFTNADGAFLFKINGKELAPDRDVFLDLLFFQVYIGEERVAMTYDEVVWTPAAGDAMLLITITLPMAGRDRWRLSGRAFYPDGAPAADVRLEAWDRGPDQLLTRAFVDPDGGYELTFDRSDLGNASPNYLPDVYFNAWHDIDLLLSTKETPLRKLKPGDYVQDLPLPAPPVATANARVRGRIFTEERRGASGLRVAAYDINVGSSSELGTALTDAAGAYEIRYPTPAPGSDGKPLADLQVKVFSAETREKALAASPIRYNAGTDELIDLVLPAGAVDRPAEYRRLTTMLNSHLATGDRTARLARLQEDEERQDITYLANKTGWDGRMVAMAALADQFAERTDVAPDLYYALFRAGMPANEAVLSRTEPATVMDIWKKAIEARVISPEWAGELEINAERFQARAAAHLLEADPRVGVSSMRDVLSVSIGQNTNRQQQFLQRYLRHEGTLDDFWRQLDNDFDRQTTDRLRVNGKLAFLTGNNAQLMARLNGQGTLASPLELVQQGLYQAEAWQELLAGDISVPPEIPGATDAERKANYADYMAGHLSLSYPTAVVAEMVRRQELALPADERVKSSVYRFLAEHQGKFELGLQPVAYYLQKNQLTLEAETLTQIKHLQRVYQISPSNAVMGKLLDHQLDSAYAVVQYDEETFVDTFAEALGGAATARLTYAKAHQVHHAVLNIATAYLTYRASPALYGAPSPTGQNDALLVPRGLGDDILAYPTLESLFGEMDYCDCEHCRSVLSPAAYLVDLLQFIELRRYNSLGVELPPTYELENPLDVLLERRPDIQHLQLTCENTNTVLPYIDLVNEILEYFVVHNASLQDFQGFNVEEGTRTEDLLANPQFVNEEAYRLLLEEVYYPLSLPFHRSLEALRLFFDHFDLPLPAAMEALRRGEALDAGDADVYAWRDIRLERLRLSRPEYALLTDSGIPLPALYGLDPDTVTDQQLVATLANVKTLSRALGITYDELVAIAKTQFLNANGRLLPKLERLGLSFATLRDVNDGTISETELAGLLPEGIDTTRFGGDIGQWIRDHFDQIMALIVLSDPTGNPDECNFEQLELRYALPDFDHNRLRPVEFLRLIRFVRLWKRLGWTIEQTDKAINALYPSWQWPLAEDDDETVLAKLDAGFAELILSLATVVETLDLLGLRPKRDLPHVLAFWAPIDTYGDSSLYHDLFLSPAIAQLDTVFAEDGYGNFPGDSSAKFLAHRAAIQAAFGLNAEGFDLLTAYLGFDDQTDLTLVNLSQVFRHAFLARRLRLNIRELLTLRNMTGIDPFAAPADPLPAIRRLIERAQRMKDSPFRLSRLAYYLQHEDWSGKASPPLRLVLDFARNLRADLQRIEGEHRVEDDPEGEIARAKMALVYGNEVASTFFGLLQDTVAFTVAYSHPQPVLDAAIVAVTGQLSYDDFQKTLSFRGLLTDSIRIDLKNATATPAAFDTAIDDLYEAAWRDFRQFFDRYPDLEALFNNYKASSAPEAQKRTALLAAFLPELRDRLKRQQIRQAVAAALGAEPALSGRLLEDKDVLHADGQPGQPAIEDFLRLETQGLSAAFFFAPDVNNTPDLEATAVDGLVYRPGGATLPPNGANPGAPISGSWRGRLEAPANGFYNLYVETNGGATIDLILDGQPLTIASLDGVWQNQQPIELKTGRLYALEIIVRQVSDLLVLKWESKGVAREPIPVRFLYPERTLEHFQAGYLRLLKVLAIVEELDFSESETAYFGAHADYVINGESWPNVLPVTPVATGPAVMGLSRTVDDLLQYQALKGMLKIKDDSLLAVFEMPEVTGGDGRSAISRLTGWTDSALATLYDHFGISAADMGHLATFLRVKAAMAVQKTIGMEAASLVAVVTNDPDGETLRTLQSALRARYEESAWRQVVQPINDELRSRQRDALVDYVLHQLKQAPATAHIDTPDKLFEFFLIDVQMDPCMKTSRIKQALSTVQLFIQRCLLNLETRVAPASIKSKQWEWMKRYRVWEANRKVFLFPENWLEPELRDNKSPFFEELESELLQSDITEDSAARALGGYLQKLEEVAKLEICGMYMEEHETDTIADDIIHVIGRTAGARRRYYYRRQEYSYWTPWRKVDPDIEDNPVLPVVWRGRLFLFWVSLIKEGPRNTQPASSSSGDLADLNLNSLKADSKITVRANLYWSEYQNGKWQPPKTSDVLRPVLIGSFAADQFNREDLQLRSAVNQEGHLIIYLSYPPNVSEYFKLYNTHSLPVLRGQEDVKAKKSGSPGKKEYIVQKSYWGQSLYQDMGIYLYVLPRSRAFSTENGQFTIAYTDPYDPDKVDREFTQALLGRAILYRVVEPGHEVKDLFEAPFFFQDRRHVFFVRPVESKVTVGSFQDFGIWEAPSKAPELLLPPLLIKPEIVDIYPPRDPRVDFFRQELLRAGVAANAQPVGEFLKGQLLVNQALFTGGAVLFNGKLIGPGGGLDATASADRIDQNLPGADGLLITKF